MITPAPGLSQVSIAPLLPPPWGSRPPCHAALVGGARQHWLAHLLWTSHQRHLTDKLSHGLNSCNGWKQANHGVSILARNLSFAVHAISSHDALLRDTPTKATMGPRATLRGNCGQDTSSQAVASQPWPKKPCPPRNSAADSRVSAPLG